MLVVLLRLLSSRSVRSTRTGIDIWAAALDDNSPRVCAHINAMRGRLAFLREVLEEVTIAVDSLQCAQRDVASQLSEMEDFIDLMDDLWTPIAHRSVSPPPVDVYTQTDNNSCVEQAGRGRRRRRIGGILSKISVRHRYSPACLSLIIYRALSVEFRLREAEAFAMHDVAPPSSVHPLLVLVVYNSSHVVSCDFSRCLLYCFPCSSRASSPCSIRSLP